MREPLFKPVEFYASKKTRIPQSLPEKVTSGTQTPPDVTIGATGIENPVTPDLLRVNTDGKDRLLNQVPTDSDEDLVTHLRTKKRNSHLKRKSKKRHDSEDSASASTELEDDNYIPEVR